MRTTKRKTHYTASELLNPANPITVCLIGAGGSGSQVLTGLARMSHSLQALGHAGLHVSLWDNDTISEANRGRQLFAHCEVGLPKATALITRTNRFFGTDWKAVNKPFTRATAKDRAALYISCVDTAAARFEIAQVLGSIDVFNARADIPRYWLDFGNGRDTGQVVLATIGDIKQPATSNYSPVARLPFVTEEFGELLTLSDANGDMPSCSLAEALEKQDLYINGALAQMGCALLWGMLRNGMTRHRGFFLNLRDFRSQPLEVG
jgi:PRTRC genetic system ThiF family protein